MRRLYIPIGVVSIFIGLFVARVEVQFSFSSKCYSVRNSG